jgi:Concanavalin A-like lectin/glucanases superfamily/SPRY domain
MFSASKSAAPSGGYTINNSLRFRSSASAYLNRSTSAGNQQIFTFSAWVKYSIKGVDSSIFSAGALNNDLFFQFNTSSGTAEVFQIFGRNSSSTQFNLLTTQVFRDPSSWYHIVVAFDTTQATASNRIKFYVNGSQVTAFSTATYPAQNANININKASSSSYIGNGVGSLNYLDGYLAEVNFIDGQQLTPSSFGSTNSTTGVWQPAKYTGTYGTNGFYLPFKLNSTSTYQANYTTTSQYLNVASNAAFGYGTGDFTIEGWHYATASGTSYLFDQRTSTSQVVPALYISGGSYTVYINGAIPLTAGTVVTNQWVHWALVKSSGTTKLYLNGISVGSFSDSNNYINSPFTIGNVWSGTTYAWAGYLSNVRVVKGTAVYTSNFTPSSTPLTAISGTSLLTLQNSTIIDNSTNAFSITNNGSITTSTATPFVANIAGDASGNGNSWQTNNINYSTVGTTYDSMTDVPTLTSATVANYPTLNPLSNTSTLAGANLDATNIVLSGSTMATPSSGKWYFEYTQTTSIPSGSVWVGVSSNLNAVPDNQLQGYSYATDGRKVAYNSYTSGYGATWTNGDVIGCAIDLDGATITFYKNGTSQGTAFTGITVQPYVFAISTGGTASTRGGSVNFGQRPFTYTPPSGYVALNTYNLPTSTIVQGNKYMDATLYTGTNANLNVTNAGAFKPDLIWLKVRSVSGNHAIFDSSRGANLELSSSMTNGDMTANAGTGLLTFNSNGFGLGTEIAGTAGGSTNNSGQTYVGWQWQAGQGSTSSNTNGSITSTVSVNASAGFSIVTYTGNSVNGATVGHGLGVTPAMIIIKERSAGNDWLVWHQSNGTQIMFFTTAAKSTNAGAFNNTLPTSSVITLGTWDISNGSPNTYVAYCWAAIPGFSAFGSYTGSGSADGPFIYTGFRPKFVMTKQTGSVSNWSIHDSSRATYNLTINDLYADTNDAEYTGTNESFDFLSNGFKPRSVGTPTNASGGTYIYMAFAEVPTKFANAR